MYIFVNINMNGVQYPISNMRICPQAISPPPHPMPASHPAPSTGAPAWSGVGVNPLRVYFYAG